LVIDFNRPLRIVQRHRPHVVGEVLLVLEVVSVLGCGGEAAGEVSDADVCFRGSVGSDGAVHDNALDECMEAKIFGCRVDAGPGDPLAACFAVFVAAQGFALGVGIAAREQAEAVVGLDQGSEAAAWKG
jgi:hypothetical protein